MTGFGHPDWQPASLAADNQQLVDFRFFNSLASGASISFGPYTVRQFVSLAGMVHWQASNQFEYLQVDLSWGDDNNFEIWKDTFIINPDNTAGPRPVNARLRTPCWAPLLTMTLTNLGSAGALHQYEWVIRGSFRPVDRSRVVEAWTGQTAANDTRGVDGTLMALVDTYTAITFLPMPIHWGECYGSFANGGGANVNCSFQIWEPVLSQVVFGTAALGAGGVQNGTFRLASRAYQLKVTPAGAGTVKPIVFVHASNE